ARARRPGGRWPPSPWAAACRCASNGSGGRLAVMCEREVLLPSRGPHRLRSGREQHEATDRRPRGGGRGLGRGGWRRSAASRSVARGARARARRPVSPLPEVWAVVVALSPDGSRAAAVTIEGTVYVWDVAT